MSTDDKAQLDHICMPGAHSIASKLKECLTDRGSVVTISSTASAVRPKPLYTASLAQKVKTRAAHDMLTRHIAGIADQAVAHHQKILDRKKAVAETADRLLVLQQQSGCVSASAASKLFAQNPFEAGDDDEDDEEDDDSESDDSTENDGNHHQGAGLVPFSTHSNGSGVMNASTHSTSSNGHSGAAVTTTAVGAAASITAAFGKVLRQRSTSDIDAEHHDRAVAERLAGTGNPSVPVRKGSINIGNKANNALHALNLGPAASTSHAGTDSKLVALSKQSFKGRNKEEFFRKFLRTQVSAILFNLSFLLFDAVITDASAL